jgi:agmatinase
MTSRSSRRDRRPPPDAPRFAGLATFARLPYRPSAEGADFAVVGVPFDLGTSYRPGARFGPAAVREASRLIRRAHPVHGVDVYEHLAGVDCGDAPVVPSDLAASVGAVERHLGAIVAAGAVPVCLGGDHTVSLPVLRALSRRHAPVALLHFDAHSDTEDSLFGTRINHATPFRRAAEEGLIDPRRSTQVGMRGSLASLPEWDEARSLGFELIPAHELARLSAADVCERMRARAAGAPAYLSFDVDFVDPAYAPGTGTPEVGGPTSREALDLLRGLTGVAFVGCDVVEVCPDRDAGGVTALLAATVAFEFLALLAVERRRKEKR